jgi:hypothetical protein
MSDQQLQPRSPILQVGIVFNFIDEEGEAHSAARRNPAHRFFDANTRPLAPVEARAGSRFERRVDLGDQVELEAELRSAFGYLRERAGRRPGMLRAAGYESVDELEAHFEDILASSGGGELIARLRSVLSSEGVRWPEPDGGIKRVCCLCDTCSNCLPPPPPDGL